MKYGKILYCDCANGPGLRTTLFVSGCRRHCPGCFNEETWDFGYGKEFTYDTECEILESLKNPNIDGLSILGGEPFELENRVVVSYLAVGAKELGKTVWIYTGFQFKDLLMDAIDRVILRHTDVLVDGPFIQEERDISLKFRGSANQRIIDVRKSLMAEEVVLKGEYM